MNGERAPWIIGGAIIVAGLLIAVALYLSRSTSPGEDLPPPAPSVMPAGQTPSPTSGTPQPDAQAQHTLRASLQAANDLRTVEAGYTDANTFELGKAAPQFTYIPAVRASTTWNEVSVANSGTSWAGATMSGSGTCYWIRDVIDEDDGSTTTTYGSGTPCTASAALASANLETWPPG